MARTAIVIGAGIVGLATARALAVRGYKVKVIERNEKATGASVRNFGMIWPIGQPDGELYERALLSKNIWRQLCDEAKIWYDEVGSLHLAYAKDEWDVMQEFESSSAGNRPCKLLSPSEALTKSAAIVADGLKGSLWSPDEMIVDPRMAIAVLPAFLHEKYGVEFIWGKTVTDVCYPAIYLGSTEMEADKIFICSGTDFETLYPEIFAAAPLTKCKLQMMRMIAQPDNRRIGPALCGSLSLIHYNSFAVAPSLVLLKERFTQQYPDYIRWGIHVMVAQNQTGELTVGDSHQYGLTHDPFDKLFINRLILDYLSSFARFKDETIIETWHGLYPKLTNGQTEIVLSPENGVSIINGLGGAGMTLSFGLCEQLIRDIIG